MHAARYCAGMQLADYLKSKPPGTADKICKAAGIYYNTLKAIADRRSVPRYQTAQAIERATDGAVTIAEMCDRTPKRRQR